MPTPDHTYILIRGNHRRKFAMLLPDAAQQPGVGEPSSIDENVALLREVYIRLRKFTRRRDGERRAAPLARLEIAGRL